MPTTTHETETAAVGPTPSLWKNRDFSKFWFGESLSLIGTQVTYLALPLTALYSFNASDAEVGVLRFLQLAPYIFFSLLFGVWVDRHRRREVMLWTNAVRMVLIALIPVLHWFGVLNIVELLIIASAVGVASVMFDVSWMPYVPSIVKNPRHFVEANAKVAISYSTATVAGPGVAGVLVAVVTAPGALIVDSFSYMISIVSLLMIRTPEARPAPPPERHVVAELRAGVHFVFSRPTLRWLAILGFCNNASMTAVWTVFLLYGTHELGFTAATIGAIFAAASVGGILGAATTQAILKRFRLGPVYFVNQTLVLAGPLLIVVAGGPKLVEVGLIILSFFTTYLGCGVSNVIVSTTRALSTPQSMMSRMTACFRTLLYGGGAVGGLAGGVVAGWLGDKTGLIVFAVLSAAAVALLVPSPLSRTHALPSPVTDEVTSSG